jgi:hypothetical protein
MHPRRDGVATVASAGVGVARGGVGTGAGSAMGVALDVALGIAVAVAGGGATEGYVGGGMVGARDVGAGPQPPPSSAANTTMLNVPRPGNGLCIVVIPNLQYG